MILEDKKNEYRTHFDAKEFTGINTYGEHSDLESHELRECLNLNILSNGNLKSRNGSQFLIPETGAAKRPFQVITNITWDIGSEEYLITQESDKLYYQALLVPANHVLINHIDTTAISLGDSIPCDMFLNGDRLFVFHPNGNFIIEWTGTIFTARPMGMTYPVIIDITIPDAGVLSGKYTWGIEKVYQVAGVDVVASTPNRYTIDRVINSTADLDSNRAILTIQSDELDDDDLWTHIRLWRSKNQLTTYDSIANPIDAIGIPDEIYEVSLITRAEMVASGLTAIATGATLPVGNSNTTAGTVAGVYTITDNALDERLGELIGLDRMELIPLPKANVGTFHRNKIYVADVAEESLNDSSGDNIYYSIWAGTKYSEQYDPQQFIQTGRDGQKVKKLISFEKDLLVLKEGKTGRIIDGDIALTFEVLDHRTGINHKNMAEYIPSVGICAITTDNGDFKVFAFDYLWHNKLNGLEISKNIRSETSIMEGLDVSMTYVNGNLFLADNSSAFVYCLNVEQRKGWTKFEYPMEKIERLFSFANNNRGGIVSSDTYTVEINIKDLETDINTGTDLEESIPVHWVTYKFRANDADYILEFDSFEVMGKFNSNVYGILFVNSVTWPLMTEDTETRFLTSPENFTSLTALRDKEYRVFVEPATIGDYIYQVPVGNYLHMKVKSLAPCTARVNKLWCVVDENVNWASFDPFQLLTSARVTPSWDEYGDISETGDADDEIDESGIEVDEIEEGA